MTNIHTVPVDTNQHVTAYWIVSPVSDEVAQVIAAIQAALKERFSASVWTVPRESLHISFNALSPIYESDELASAPADVSPSYKAAFKKLVSGASPIELHFDIVEAFPAAIILKATDDGSYKTLRDQFNKAIKLPASTKATPNIIHTTICKFHEEIDFDEVKDLLTTKSVQINMTVSEFRIVREKILYMVDYDVLERYPLIAG